MANRCSKISKTEQKKYDAYQKVIMQNYGSYQLPADAEDRKTEFAERLKTQMEKKQMTPAALALASGASATTIRKLLKGEYNKVSLTHIYLFAVILSCTPHYLVGLVDTPAGVCSPDMKKKALHPITFASTPEIDFLETMKKVAREDREFVDYIYQIVNAGPDRIADVKKILEAVHFVTKKESAPIPHTWNGSGKL